MIVEIKFFFELFIINGSIFFEIENVRIINAQTPDHQFIRVSMIPTLLSFVKDNKGYTDTFGMFEIGHTVEGLNSDTGYCNEVNKLGAVSFSKSLTEEEVFSNLADMAKELCRSLLHKEPIFRDAAPVFGFEHPVNCFSVIVDGRTVGCLATLHPTVVNAIDKKASIAFLEINTEEFSKIDASAIKYNVPSKFPEIDIDVTFTANLSSVKFDEIKSAAKAASDILTDAIVQDIYNSEDGSCALTLRFSFVSQERTLTKQELSPIVDDVAKALAPFGLTVKE